VSSSVPRPNQPTAGQQSSPALAGIDADVLKSNVSKTTHILLTGTMLLFFTVCTLITLQASWQWWLIPAVIAVPVVAVLVERTNRMLKTREATRALEAELRSSRPTAARRDAR
jgi:hypothetical protein